jgi:ribosomal protein S27E
MKDVTTEVPCPIPDCGSIVYAPNDYDNVRIDCLDCGAALLTRLGIDGTMSLEVVEDAARKKTRDVAQP